MQPTADSVALMRETWIISRLCARRLMAGVRPRFNVASAAALSHNLFSLLGQALMRLHIHGPDAIPTDSLPVRVIWLQSHCLNRARLAYEEVTAVWQQIPAFTFKRFPRLLVLREPAVQKHIQCESRVEIGHVKSTTYELHCRESPKALAVSLLFSPHAIFYP